MRKTDSDYKPISFNKKVTSNKLRYLEVKRKLHNLTTKDYNFFLGRIYFASNDGSQNTFVYQSTLYKLELKKNEYVTQYVPSWRSKKVYNSKFKSLHTAFLHSIECSGYIERMNKIWWRSISCRTKQLLHQNCRCLDCLWFRCLAKISY